MAKCSGAAITAAFIGGALAGAALGLLFAPEKGADQRQKIKDALAKRGIKLDRETFENLVDELKSIGRKQEPSAAEDYDVE